jgi:putative nucleotidyltransferase with HDIG domain
MKQPQQPSRIPMTELERKLEELPLLPAVVSEVLALNPNADDYFDRLLRLAERDPPFAVSVLRCANSASSAPLTTIVSLEQAVTRLGAQRCAGLILALAVIKVFVPRSEAQRYLWIHSLQTALFARMFCQRIPSVKSNAGHAYICGLLHDIGRFVQFEGAPADLTRVDDMRWASPQELIDAERSALGYDHSLLGWHACEKWRLPATIGEVVRRHHEILPIDCHGTDELVRVVQWADKLSTALIMNPAMSGSTPDQLISRLETEYPGIGPAAVSGEQQLWHRWVTDVRAESMQLAGQLNLI